MKTRFPLHTKILLLAFLNLSLLGLALAIIVRAQFRLDPGSFLLAPAQSRIMTLAHAVALELEATQPGEWNSILARYSQVHRVQIALFDESGEHVAGPELQMPRSVFDRIPRRQRPPESPPRPEQRRDGTGRDPGPREPRPPAPPLFLTASSSPTAYWAGARIPVRRDQGDNPHPGTLLMMSQSLLSSPLFLDFTPWLTIATAVILISAACWLPFIRGITRSLAQMTRATEQIADGHFEVHVADVRRDEIGRLGQAVNRMATRLSGFVDGQKAFLSGIAHELCSPLATIQFGLGNLERRIGDEQLATLTDIQEEVQHMSSLVHELLSFSRAGVEATNTKLSEVNVAATVARVLEREASPNCAITVNVDESLKVLAEPEYLFRALSNVVRNAIRYAGHAGPIEISARLERGTAYVTVSDSGPGVPEERLEEIFAPFYRLDPARSRQTGGIGLGLAIVRTCIEACRGAVQCRNRRPSGLEVEIRLSAAM